MTQIDKNKRILMLVESPNKVHKIKEIMTDLGYNKCVVMATAGHTTNIKDNRASYKNTGIHPEDDFKADYAIMDDKKKLVSDIKEQAKIADIVLIASDPDREGENLGNHIKELIKVKDSNYYRVMYHSITKTDVEKAIEAAGKMNKNLVAAAEARQIIDKLIGYSLTPEAKLYMGAKSVGRCQSVGLKIVADREKEIQNFIPETYYDLYLNFTKNKTNFKAKYIGTDNIKVEHLKSAAEVAVVKQKCTGNYIVKDIVKKEKQESPKLPFITATIQQELSAQLNLKVKDVMSICQKNFEAGFTTYHRVDAPILSDEFIPIAQAYIEKTFGKENYAGPRPVKIAETAQNGHEAIRCTDITLTPEKAKSIIKNDLQWKVYCIVWKRTLQSLMPNAVYDSQTIIINNNDQLFKIEQKVLKSPGFKMLD